MCAPPSSLHWTKRLRERLKNLLPRGSFLGNVSILTGGTVAAQGLSVLALPLLTRLYSPEDFALLAVYGAVTSMITVAACLRYNIAIPLPEHDTDGMALTVAALLSATVVSILIAVPLLSLPVQSAALMGQPGLAPYLWMVPFGVFFSSTYDALQYWASRNRRFDLVARTRVTRAVAGIGTQLSIGAAASSPFGLMFGQLVNGAFGIWSLARNNWKKDQPILLSIGKASVVTQAARFRHFPIWSVPEALSNTASQELPIIVIAAIVAGPEAGFLLLAMKVMAIPVQLIGSSVAQVFLAEAPERLRDGTLAHFTRRTMWALFKTGAPPLMVVGVLSPILFPLIFGAEWQRAGWLVTWMTPWFVLQFIASPTSMVLIVTERVKLAFALQVFGLIARAAPIFVVDLAGASALSETFAISSAFFYWVYLIVILGALRSR